MSMPTALKLVIVAPQVLDLDPDNLEAHHEVERLRSLHTALIASHYQIVAVLPADTFLPERIAQIQPDMIVVDAESQARDILEHVVIATRHEPRPIVLFTENEDTSDVRAAIAAGVSTYVVAGTPWERIKPILDIALAQFEHAESLKRELAAARTQLEERKIIERAKGLLMSKQQCTEQEAYSKLRKTAMDRGLKLVEVAQRLLDVADVWS